MKNVFRGVFALLAMLLLWGTMSCNTGTSGNPNASGVLYALDEFNDAIYVYDDALTINGSLGPNRTIAGTVNTALSEPTFLAVDGFRDILYVADHTFGNILAFAPASTLDGDVSPLRKYPGVTKVGYMFYDHVNDTLYVTDVTNLKIFAWDKISTLPTGTAPNRSFGLGYVPTGIFVDIQRDLLYVGDPAVPGVQVYDKPSTKSSTGTVTPVRTLTQPFSQGPPSVRPLQNLNGLTMNTPNDLLFITESSDIFSDDNNSLNDFTPSVEMYDNTSNLTGTVNATRELMGGTTGLTIDMLQPLFLVSFDKALLFVQVNMTTVSVWSNANQLDGDVAPDRSVQISPANARIVSFDVDLSH